MAVGDAGGVTRARGEHDGGALGEVGGWFGALDERGAQCAQGVEGVGVRHGSLNRPGPDGDLG